MDSSDGHADRLYDFLRTWGAAEMFLDFVMVAIYRDHNGREFSPARIATLTHKLTFLSDAFAGRPALATFQPLAEEVVAMFRAEMDLRNTIIHGAPLKMERNGAVHFVRYRPNFESPNYEIRVVRPKDWQRLDETCTTVMALLLVLHFALNPGEAALDHTEDADGALRMKVPANLPVSKRLRDLLQEMFAGGPRD